MGRAERRAGMRLAGCCADLARELQVLLSSLPNFRLIGARGRPILRRLSWIAVVLVAVQLPGRAHAQGVQTSTLTGAVTCAGEAVAGVTVSATSSSLLGARSTVTGASGSYILRALPPGSYRVRYELAGAPPVEREVLLALGQVSRADVEIVPVAESEELTVVSAAQSVLETTTVGRNFSDAELGALPITRTLPEIAGFAPGTSNNTPNGPQVTISGGFAYDNVFLVNGVDVNDNVFGFPNTLYIEDAIAEVQVLTSGISAEYGRFSGGVINVVTKSGGKVLAGSVRADLGKPEWRDETPIEAAQGIEREGDLSQYYQATVGGPLLRDRLWFFLAGRDEASESVGTYPVTGSPFATTIENRRFEVKLTGDLAPGHSLQASLTDNQMAHGNRAVFPFSIDPRVEIDRRAKNELRVASYAGLFTDRLLGELRWSEKLWNLQNTGGWSTALIDSPFLARGATPGIPVNSHYNAPYFDNRDPESRNNEQIAAALSTFLASAGMGSHDLKLGWERFRSQRIAGGSASATGFVFVADPVAAGGQVVYDAQGRIVPNYVPGVSLLEEWIPIRGAELAIETQSLYLNDRWSLGSRWSFNLGARFERVRSEASGGASQDEPLDAATLVPRLGVSFDLFADGRLMLDATWAEYVGRATEAQFDRNSAVGNPTLIQRLYSGPAGQGLDFAPAFDLTNWGIVTAINVPEGNVDFDEELSPPTTGEITFAAGARLPNAGFAKLIYTRRSTSDLVEDFIRFEDGTVVVAVDGVTRTVDRQVYENSDVPRRKYEALQLQGRCDLRPNWTVDLGWTWQLQNDGDFEGEEVNTAPMSSSRGDYPEILVPARNEPDGRLNDYQEHKVRLASVYGFDLGAAGALDVALVWRYDSPTTFSYVAFAVPLSPQQVARDPGYALRPPSQTLYFGERGLGEFNATSLFDVAATYRIPVWRSVEPWVRVDVRNLFNDDTLETFNTSVTADPTGPQDADGLPTNHLRGPNFGQATSTGNYVPPREFALAFGVRF